ncbi:MAG: hypothetical protein LBB76_12045 [Azoarcus sp.]|jgi:hypothetical protein|nr:hypothetical protein [Azoarcus sp.]
MISPLPESSSRSWITPLRVAFAVCLLCVGAGRFCRDLADALKKSLTCVILGLSFALLIENQYHFGRLSYFAT